MTGEQLKREIKGRGFTLKSVADRLGTTPQNLGGRLQSDDVASSLMEVAADVMGISVADFYRPGDTISAVDHSTAVKGTYNCDQRLLGIIESRDRQIDRLIEMLGRNSDATPSSSSDD